MEGPEIDVDIDIPDSTPDFIIRELTHKPPHSSDPVPETKRVLSRIEVPPGLPSLLLHHLRTRKIRKNELKLGMEEIAGLVVHEHMAELGNEERVEDPLLVPVWDSGARKYLLWEGEDDVSWRWVAEFIDFETEVFGEVGEEGE
jgi:hypothetical protein